MAWRLAHSLDTLRTQVNQAYPNRNKASDGTISDAAHAATATDHSPNPQGVVCALDITHSPQTGFDAHALADRLRVNRHPNLKYIISNRRIAGDWTGWNWRSYSGSNPHDKHIHISVGRGPDGKSTQPYDDRVQWNIKGGDMPITPGQQDKAIKMGLRRPPSAAELNNPDWRNNPGLMIDTLWANGGEASYNEDQKPKTYKPYTLPPLFVKE